MNEKIVIDSSVFISALGNPDIFTKESKSFFIQIAKQNIPVILPTIVVAETLVKIYRYKRRIKKISESFFDMELVSLDLDFLKQLSSLIKEPKLKTSDLIIAVCAKLASAVLISWDKRHLSKENYLCETLTPKEYLLQGVHY